jgi:hypothetical protein
METVRGSAVAATVELGKVRRFFCPWEPLRRAMTGEQVAIGIAMAQYLGTAAAAAASTTKVPPPSTPPEPTQVQPPARSFTCANANALRQNSAPAHRSDQR